MRVNYLTHAKWWSIAQVNANPDHRGFHYGWDESSKRAVVVMAEGDRWVEARD